MNRLRRTRPVASPATAIHVCREHLQRVIDAGVIADRCTITISPVACGLCEVLGVPAKEVSR